MIILEYLADKDTAASINNKVCLAIKNVRVIVQKMIHCQQQVT